MSPHLLLNLRRSYRQQWTSSCTITHVSGRTLNEATNRYDETTVEVYAGKCSQVRPADYQTKQDVYGDEPVSNAVYEVDVPHTVSPDLNDRFVASSAVDPDLVGASMVIRGVVDTDFLVARRLVLEYQRPSRGE